MRVLLFTGKGGVGKTTTARRTHTYLSLFGYRVDAVVANRLLPEAITDPWGQLRCATGCYG